MRMGPHTVAGRSLCHHITTVDELADWVKLIVGIRIPRHPVCPGHNSPMEYLCRSHFEPARDLVVWAPRGGGKTRLGAIATLLDLLLKPGCQVRILGGSLEQSFKMWDHLWPDIARAIAMKGVRGSIQHRRIELANGSSAAVLTQSQRAVRGLHVQKLRCDEVELFDPDVWEAAQLVTRSRQEGTPVAGVVEAISTLHTPFGLMHRIVEQAQVAGVPVVRWCLLEVLERCPVDRPCAGCVLEEDCRGVAKTLCDGFVKIDDAIAMKRRVSKETWESEMLCRRPCLRNAVFPSFDPSVHIRDYPLSTIPYQLSLGIDFGFSAPFVCLWIATDPHGLTHVIDEYVQEQRLMEEHLAEIRSRPWKPVKRVACDPAGNGRNDQTALSNVTLLRNAGYLVRTRQSHIVDGLELIRHALQPAAGQPKLFIHPRCQRLIRALQSYRYGEDGSELPIKDGTHDHLIDALRYHFVNRESARVIVRRY
ncbi:MAG: hypothetical protein ACM359_08645 [Bacillota bacterium]